MFARLARLLVGRDRDREPQHGLLDQLLLGLAELLGLDFAVGHIAGGLHVADERPGEGVLVGRPHVLLAVVDDLGEVAALHDRRRDERNVDRLQVLIGLADLVERAFGLSQVTTDQVGTNLGEAPERGRVAPLYPGVKPVP